MRLASRRLRAPPADANARPKSNLPLREAAEWSNDPPPIRPGFQSAPKLGNPLGRATSSAFRLPGFSLSNGVLRAVYRWVNSLRRFRRSKLSEPRCCDLELPCAKVFMRRVASSHLTISRLPDLGRGGRGELALIGREVAGAAWAANANLQVASREALDRGQVLAHPRSCAEGPRNFFLESEVSPFQSPNRRRIVAIKASPSGS